MNYHLRQKQVLLLAVQKALELPLRESGLWFHGDIRDNVYYAEHVLVASWTSVVDVPNWLVERANSVLLESIRLQVRETTNPMYGHFPLGLEPDPRNAKPNTLPAELMGTVLLHFYKRFQEYMNLELRAELNLTFLHIYQSGFFRRTAELMNHHESKYVALQIGYGYHFDDEELYNEGKNNLSKMLLSVKTQGMREYGALPWFWHWVQAFTCVWEIVDDGEVKHILSEMIDELWERRASQYLRGAWVGPHSRGLPHDLPADRNNLFDYVVFGNFQLPGNIYRLETAGLLEREVSERIRQIGLERETGVEVKRLIPVFEEHGRYLHSFTYITDAYAVGGVYEYVKEFDNEQHRWDVTLPTDAVGNSVNKVFFFHPGEGYNTGDDRHTTGHSELLLNQDAVAVMYRIPNDQKGFIIGCLPLGEWQFADRRLCGHVGGVYFSICLMNEYTWEQKNDRISIHSDGNVNGVVVEFMNASEAEGIGILSLEAFSKATAKDLEFHANDFSVNFQNIRGEKLELKWELNGDVLRAVNECPISFEGYRL
jgi:hypothetical protein